MGALNIPSAADIERLTRRLRSVSLRLEGIEEGVDRLDRTRGSGAEEQQIAERLTAIEDQLKRLSDRLDRRKPEPRPAKPRSRDEAGARQRPRKPAPKPRTRKPRNAAEPGSLSRQALSAAIAVAAHRLAPPRAARRSSMRVRAARASNVSETASTHATGTPARAPTANSAAASISTASAPRVRGALVAAVEQVDADDRADGGRPARGSRAHL